MWNVENFYKFGLEMWKTHVIINLRLLNIMTTSEYYFNDIWSKTLEKIKESDQLSEDEMIYFTSKLIKLTETEALISVPAFINYSIMHGKTSLIQSCLEEVIGKKVMVSICLPNDVTNTPVIENISFQNDFISRQIDTNQTFANFVTGRSNAQAHLASMTCANNLGILYNPLFIYGDSGLGKTHLLNAIGNEVRRLYPNKQIGFISGLEFVEGVAKASKENRLDEFKQSFYGLDLLIVDDIQFIAGKDKTHEIFFTVFNNLVNNKKQICISADRIPSEIKGLEERIISRFNQGLTINIEAPEYDTAINILKAEIKNNSSPNQYDIDDDVYSYLATNFSHDVRSLKGAIARLLFYSIDFTNGVEESGRITLKLAQEAFKDQIQDNKNEITIQGIRKVVCNYYNLTTKQINSATRTKNIANARHIAIYLCRKLLDAPYKEIGDEFGKRDHTTVMSSCEKVEKLIKTEPLYLKAINEIEARISK